MATVPARIRAPVKSDGPLIGGLCSGFGLKRPSIGRAPLEIRCWSLVTPSGHRVLSESLYCRRTS